MIARTLQRSLWTLVAAGMVLFALTRAEDMDADGSQNTEAAKAEITAVDVKAETLGPKNGALIIVGGGLTPEIFGRFVKLAGGKDKNFIFIPTAMADNNVTWMAVNLRSQAKQFGLKNYSILHTRDRREADTEKFVAPIRKADGVWFGGGRQWRFVDAYGGTLALKEFHKVLERGGVIGGDSAGATIQGSFLARGDTKGNQVMMGDHQEGFGFITNCAIDQHAIARNRQFDLFQIRRKHPKILCFGIDEFTALVVVGNTATVIGDSYVAVYDGRFFSTDTGRYRDVPKDQEWFYYLRPGMQYDLKNRRVRQR